MDFTYNDLMPSATGYTLRRVVFDLPLTPFFVNPGTSAQKRTIGFHGMSFPLQFKSTRAFDENGTLTNDPICGTEAFRTFTSVDLDEEAVFRWSGSRKYSYLFNTSNNTVIVQTVEEGKPTIGSTHSRTATTAKQNYAFHDPPDHIEITLSDAVDKAWLSGELQRWESQSEVFRNATGRGLGTYSFIGHGATRSESDGYLAIVGGGEVAPLGYTFSGTPYGMVGDEGELWNGNFSTWVNTVLRKNAPVIHRESSPNNLSFEPNKYVGSSIYKAGYAEIEVSEPLEDFWKDAYGVFQSDTALDGVPMKAEDGNVFSPMLYYVGDGAANELTLISRTGKRYRVTVQVGYYDYESDESDWVTLETHVLTTDPATLRTTFQFTQRDDDASDTRVASIEEEVQIDGHPEWQTVADLEMGSDPQTLIGSSVTGDFLLLAGIKTRRGTKFGFTALDYSGSEVRYRKRVLRVHKTPGTYTVDAGGCGGGVTGSADLETEEEYDMESGLPLPRVVTQYSVTINGQDWTPETIASFDILNSATYSATVLTATKARWNYSYEATGSFLVAFDAPLSSGKIIDSSWQNVPMAFAAGVNKGSNIGLTPPASGFSLFFEGHRLTYSPASG